MGFFAVHRGITYRRIAAINIHDYLFCRETPPAEKTFHRISSFPGRPNILLFSCMGQVTIRF